MTAFATHMNFEFRSGVRNKSLLLLNYLFPLGFYLMASALMTGLNPEFHRTLIPAMVLFTVLSSALLGLPDPIVTARETGIYRSYKIHGIPKLSILLIPVLTTILHTTVVTVIIVLTAPLLFNAVLPANLLSFALGYLLMAFACSTLGLLIGVVAPNSRATVLLGQAVFLPSMMIGGLMFPAHALPETLSKLAALLPSNHATNIMNGWVEGGIVSMNPYLSTAVLFAGGAIALGLALYLFNWDGQNKSKHNAALGFLALAPYVIAVAVTLF
ncbi:MAG: ABC transporter permease [Anaerolineae bacterium]|nr:ABC transporter permease [Chloroflexota bacterium]MBP6298543.1 ABC transporter permease [Anaerolineae bacterium]